MYLFVNGEYLFQNTFANSCLLLKKVTLCLYCLQIYSQCTFFRGREFKSHLRKAEKIFFMWLIQCKTCQKSKTALLTGFYLYFRTNKTGK